MADGTVATLESGKRLDAVARQQMASQALAGLAIWANPSAYHLFVELPKRLRAATLVEMAAARGIHDHSLTADGVESNLADVYVDP